MRRDWDSNPGYPCEYTNFPGLLFRPLRHLSGLFECANLQLNLLKWKLLFIYRHRCFLPRKYSSFKIYDFSETCFFHYLGRIVASFSGTAVDQDGLIFIKFVNLRPET